MRRRVLCNVDMQDKVKNLQVNFFVESKTVERYRILKLGIYGL